MKETEKLSELKRNNANPTAIKASKEKIAQLYSQTVEVYKKREEAGTTTTLLSDKVDQLGGEIFGPNPVLDLVRQLQEEEARLREFKRTKAAPALIQKSQQKVDGLELELSKAVENLKLQLQQSRHIRLDSRSESHLGLQTPGYIGHFILAQVGPPKVEILREAVRVLTIRALDIALNVGGALEQVSAIESNIQTKQAALSAAREAEKTKFELAVTNAQNAYDSALEEPDKITVQRTSAAKEVTNAEASLSLAKIKAKEAQDALDNLEKTPQCPATAEQEAEIEAKLEAAKAAVAEANATVTVKEKALADAKQRVKDTTKAFYAAIARIEDAYNALLAAKSALATMSDTPGEEVTRLQGELSQLSTALAVAKSEVQRYRRDYDVAAKDVFEAQRELNEAIEEANRPIPV